MNNSLACYSTFLIFASTLSLAVLVRFLYMNISIITLQSRCYLVALTLQHLFFIYMIFRINQIEADLKDVIEWLVEKTGGMFIIGTVTHIVVYFTRNNKHGNNYELNLDPMQRVILILWNHLFTEIWIYSAILFLAMLFTIILIKIKQQNNKKQRQKVFQEVIIHEKYNHNMFLQQTNCSICLNDYQDNQDISKTPCGHLFHPNCLLLWIEENLTCPLCRTNIL